jgi:hypothetical protein
LPEETLDGRGAAAPFLPPDTLKKDRFLEEAMQHPQLTTYADITEVRTVTGAAACNQLLAGGWVLLGVYPSTTVAEMTSGGEQRKQDIQRYVRRLVGYVVGRRRET